MGNGNDFQIGPHSEPERAQRNQPQKRQCESVLAEVAALMVGNVIVEAGNKASQLANVMRDLFTTRDDATRDCLRVTTAFKGDKDIEEAYG